MSHGASFRPSPELKAQRAISKAVDLLAELAAWTSLGDVAVSYVATPDEGALEEVLSVSSVPDVETFFYELGEALYQLRSSLDNFAFERAKANGVPVVNERDIYFPIVNDPAKWGGRIKPLAIVPPQELNRWKQLQPFALDDPTGSPLSILDRLQIGDKHRTPLVPQPLPATLANLSFRLGDVLPHSEVDPTGLRIDFTESPELRDGQVLARYRFGREVFLRSKTATVVTELNWFVSDLPHGRVDLVHLVEALSTYMPEAFSYMRTGGSVPMHPMLDHKTGRDGTFKVFGRNQGAPE